MAPWLLLQDLTVRASSAVVVAGGGDPLARGVGVRIGEGGGWGEGGVAEGGGLAGSGGGGVDGGRGVDDGPELGVVEVVVVDGVRRHC